MDFESLASRLGIDMEDFLELVALFHTTCLADLEKIRAGIGDNSPAAVAAAAHSIKGAAANLGFEEMASLAKKMEFQGKSGRLDGFDGWTNEMDQWLDRIASRL